MMVSTRVSFDWHIMEMRRGKDIETYNVLLFGDIHTNSKASPHAQECNGLPRGVDVPLSEQRHQGGTERVHDDEDDRHEDAVGSGQSRIRRARRDARNCAATTIAIVITIVIATIVGTPRAAAAAASIAASAAASIVTATVAGTGRADKGVRIGADAGLAHINMELRHAVVLRDDGRRVRRVEGIARLPSRNPTRLAAEIEVGALAALDVGNHVAVDDARARQQLDVAPRLVGRHDVVGAGPRAERDVALAVLVHDEHVRAQHLGADAEADPLPRRRGLELEEDVAGSCFRRGFRHAPFEADAVGGTERGGGS